MKKLLITALMLGTAVVAIPSITEAKTTAAITAEPQIRVRIGPQRGRWNRNRRTRTVTNTRITRTRYGTFREVVQTTYFANGRTVTRVISRTRIRR